MLEWAATGYSFLSINGQFIRMWVSPYQQSFRSNTIVIKSFLKCGCNEIKIQVYNYRMTSPAALIYKLSQTKVGCYGCEN